MQRMLQSATDACHGPGCPEDMLWLQLVRGKLQLQGTADAMSAAGAVDAHLQLLQEPLLQLQGGRGTFSAPELASASSSAAVYLSLATTLQQAARHTSFAELCAACPSLQPAQWSAVHAESLHTLQASLPCCSQVARGICDTPALQQQQQAALACSVAAMATLPQHPAPWKAYADLLFASASTVVPPLEDAVSSESASADTQHEQQQQQQGVMLFGAAAEAYCMHLAALANTGALASPQQVLGVLVRLLQIILQHGAELQQELSQALAHCPAAVWQVLTNQLLAQLQHSSTAVRAIIQQLLQGLAVVVPCAVLYPLVVEVRTAQEAGQEVSSGAGSLFLRMDTHTRVREVN